MKKLLAIIFLSTFMLTAHSTVMAKRAAPESVSPITQADVEYRVPVSTESEAKKGIIEAWDKKSNTLLWWKQIYVVKYNPELEKDVQDVYIKKISFVEKNQSKKDLKASSMSKGFLIIETERDEKYQLNLKTLQVVPLDGARVVLKEKV